MTDSLNTFAEKQAQKAEALTAFSGLSLLHIRREITKLLSLIGREGIFSEYTSHDISHIDVMLNSLEWIVPEETQSLMSPADWLMTVLSIYFHDLGMLVTKSEFENRNSSGFPDYRDNHLFKGDSGADYKVKIEKLSEENKERFLYQEFVRHKHAERIQCWVSGRINDILGISHNVLSEVDNLLSSLKPLFRKDLALICESHHLDDLNNFKKYKVKKPYGNSKLETANLQYCAILMRTADLLHMTSDRTPSIVFKTINPSDPVSQEEWAKQMAVQRVCSKISLDREKRPDESLPRDSVEVHAYFVKKDGFFGLTSYLTYVEHQIRKSSDWVKAAQREGAQYQFPWRYVDQANIETEGFIPTTFEFTFDQAKILDLLTGHTLYNDTQVVLRELVQNSIDAIRVQELIDSKSNSFYSQSKDKIGKIEIHWNTQERILSIKDNGTGMTQDIVEQNLLKVGASRYQDTEFKKQYPSFAPISRFGIGLLSAFMIADEVEIVTCHPEEEKARQLFLQSVHGKYLIQLLDKQNDQTVKCLSPHGTLIKLSIRPSAEIEDIVEIARKWIVFPHCDIEVSINDRKPIHIGFASPKEALEDSLRNAGITVVQNADQYQATSGKIVKVKEEQFKGITVAYAVEWSVWLREWSFLSIDNLNNTQKDKFLLGTCIEGIRVEFDTPGFSNPTLIAIANTTGTNAPKTNVARSGFEMTSERSDMLKAIYTIYCNHIKSELQELSENRKYSLTWATQEAKNLIRPLISSSSILSEKVLVSIANELPVLVVEKDNQRKAIAPINLIEEEYFWTSDSEFFRVAELLIREVEDEVSISNLIDSLNLQNFQLPNELMLCGFNLTNIIDYSLFENKEIDQIKILQDQRRIDCRWANKNHPPIWYRLPNCSFTNLQELGTLIGYINEYQDRNNYHRSFNSGIKSMTNRRIDLMSSIKVGVKKIDVFNRDKSQIGAKIFGSYYIFSETDLAKYLINWLEESYQQESEINFIKLVLMKFALLFSIFEGNIYREIGGDNTILVKLLKRITYGLYERSKEGMLFDDEEYELIERKILPPDFTNLIANNSWTLFNPSLYSQL